MTKDSLNFEKSESTRDRKLASTETVTTTTEVFINSEEEAEFDKNEYSFKNLHVGSIHEAPDYLKDNEYIKHGYRVNFNSTKRILRSLFMLHNESVNIWTHLIGVLVIFLLIFYTSCSLHAHKDDIVKINIHLNITEINNEIKHITKPILDYIPNISNIKDGINKNYQNSRDAVHNYTAILLNKAYEYVNLIDEKIGFYNSYIKCVSCYEEVLDNINKLKTKLGENLVLYKDIIITESKTIIENIEDTAIINFIKDLNDRIAKFKNKHSEILKGDDLDWVDVYENQHGIFAKLERWPMFVMLVSAIICLGCSTSFHLLSAHSKKLHDLLNRLDYAGISILIAGSCYPPYYYFFYCKKALGISYLTFISTFAICVFIYSIKPDFNTPSQHKFRGILFLILGLSTAIPILHLAFFKFTIEDFKAPLPLIYWYAGGISYVTGALIYIIRFPEKWRPGKHDIWGSSHQIFHIFVLLGVAFHYFGSLDAFYYRSQYRCEI